MREYIFDYSKLKGKIREKYKVQENFAKVLGIANNTLSTKLNNTSDFSQLQIYKAINALELQKSDVCDYFFSLEVQKN